MKIFLAKKQEKDKFFGMWTLQFSGLEIHFFVSLSDFCVVIITKNPKKPCRIREKRFFGHLKEIRKQVIYEHKRGIS